MSVKFRFKIPSDCWDNWTNLRGYFLPHPV